MKKHDLFKIISIAILAFVVLSWIIPTASLSGTEIVKAEEMTRIGVWNIFNLFQVSLSSFCVYGIYLICVGVFYIVLSKTGVYQNMIEKISKKLSKKAKGFIACTIVLFAILSSVTNLGLMLFLFIPFFVSIILKMGYDKLTALLSTIGAIFVGMIGSTFGYYINYVINQTLSLELMDNLNYKLVLFIVSTTLLIVYVLNHIKGTKKNKKANAEEITDPLLIEVKEDKKEKKSMVPMIVVLILVAILTLLSTITWEATFTLDIFTKFHDMIMGVKVGSFEIIESILGAGVNVGYYTQYGVKALGQWDYTDLSIMLIFASLIISLIYKVKFNTFLSSFAESLKKFIKPAFLIVLAYTLFVLNYYIPIFTTIISWFGTSFNIVTSSIIAILSSVINIDMMYVAQGTLATLVSVVGNSNAPILSILFQAIYGLVQFIAPTSVLLIVGLCYLNVSFKDWFKSIWKLLIELLIIILLVLIVMMLI